MKVFASLRDDAHQGWVWLQKTGLPARSIVKIKNPKSGRTVYCEALQIDSNFLDEYNLKPRIPITDPSSSIVLSGWYRACLGGIATQSEYDLTVKFANGPWGKFRACTYHPQTVVRVAAWLGLLSIVLGLISVFLGATSLCGADWKYQRFNRWGIIFEYPSSFIEFSSSELQQMKDKLSAELNSIIKEGRATCGQRSIDKITMFMSNDNLVGLGINKIKFSKAPTAECFLHERQISLSDVPPAGYEMKPGTNVKVFRLEKIKISGYDGIIEDFELLDQGSRAYGFHILVGKTVYDISWIVLDKRKFREWEKALLHIAGSIKIQQK